MQIQPFIKDEVIAPHRLAVVVLKSDEVLEGEFRTIFQGDDISLHHSRIENATTVSINTLGDMEKALPAALELFPSGSNYDVIGYGCTSGATVIGSQRVESIIQTLFPQSFVSDPIRAVIAALRHLKVRKIGLLTPYVIEVSQAMISLLEAEGFIVTQFLSFNESNDCHVAHISPYSIEEAMLKVGRHEDVDVIFASCTNLRALNVIASVEKKLNKPVLTSNQALAWHMCQLGNIPISSERFGKLFIKN